MIRLLIVACALDALIFAIITLGNCRRGEYASSAAWSCLQSGKWQGRVFVPFIDAVFGWLGDVDHCKTSWQGADTPLRINQSAHRVKRFFYA